jgi:hypothetical protein
MKWILLLAPRRPSCKFGGLRISEQTLLLQLFPESAAKHYNIALREKYSTVFVKMPKGIGVKRLLPTKEKALKISMDIETRYTSP